MKNKIILISLFCLGLNVFSQENSRFVNYKWDLFRAVQGTIQITREQAINHKYALNIGLMGTYASTRGLAKPYLESQKFEYYEKATNETYNLSNVQSVGGGINLQFRRYLGKNPIVGHGFYITPELFYRILNLESIVYSSTILTNKTITRTLNLGYLGYSVGYQKIYRDMLTLDGYIGGGFFVSKYNDMNVLTRYRNAYQIDYTGFYLNMGVLIGIVR
jgi:hypothetical protein